MDGLREAKGKVGDSGAPATPFPTWLNPKLVKKGQDFIRQNFFSIFFAHFVSLILLLSYGPVRRVLIRTGRSDSPVKSIKRYLSTLLHVQQWYEGDFLQPQGVTFLDIQRVRRIHSGISRTVKAFPRDEDPQPSLPDRSDRELILGLQRSRLNGMDHQPTIISELTEDRQFSISQLDMIVTQFCFMGFVSLFPQQVGIFSKDAEGLKGFVHLWALIGHLLGVEDEFNICLEENGDAREIILHKVLVPELQKCEGGSLVLWKSLISGLSVFIPFLNLKAVLLFILKNILHLNSNPSDLESSLSLYERVCYKAMDFCFTSWLKYDACRWLLNALLRFTILLTGKRIGVNIQLNHKIQSRLV